MRLSSRGLVAELDGFNLHAGVCVAADDRDALERLGESRWAGEAVLAKILKQ